MGSLVYEEQCRVGWLADGARHCMTPCRCTEVASGWCVMTGLYNMFHSHRQSWDHIRMGSVFYVLYDWIISHDSGAGHHIWDVKPEWSKPTLMVLEPSLRLAKFGI
jgi:hypothetical protein